MSAKSALLAVLVAAAALIPGTAQAAPATPGTATVICPRLVSIADHRQYEGSVGTTTKFTFTVTSSGCANPGAVTFGTVLHRAYPVSDFTGSTGTLTFAAGDLAPRTVTVAVVPDRTGELTEDFGVILCPSTGIFNITRQRATGTILNDDGVPTELSVPLEPGFHCSE